MRNREAQDGSFTAEAVTLNRRKIMDSITIWTYSLIATTVVILIVAALLIAIVLTARKIDDGRYEFLDADDSADGTRTRRAD